jgi:hypothetical protein
MADHDRELDPEEERALRILHALYGDPDDIDPHPPVDPAAVARIRAGIAPALAEAWRFHRRAAKEHAERRKAPSVLALTRDALLARIAGLQEARTGLAFGYRNRLDRMSDDELRSLLADIEDNDEAARADDVS